MIELILSFFLSILTFGGNNLEANTAYPQATAANNSTVQVSNPWKTTKVSSYNVTSQVESYQAPNHLAYQDNYAPKPILRHKKTNHIIGKTQVFKNQRAQYDSRIGDIKVFKTSHCSQGVCHLTDWL